MSKNIILKPIGIILTPFKKRTDLNIPPYKPEAPYYDPHITGIARVFEEYKDGLINVNPGSYAMLLFHFDRSEGYELINKSPRFENPVGVFSTRSPRRPNGIGVSIVKFLSIHNCNLTFRGVDMLDGSPLLDIKPYNGKVFPD